MAQVQLIQGTGEELMTYLEKRRFQKNLLLIIPEQEVSTLARKPYPEGATLRNGVPLFPVDGRTEVVTPEHIQNLLEEE